MKAYIDQLRALPATERADALAARISDEFRTVLLMSPADELPLDQNFFDLGLTSLRLEELKQRLEAELDATIDSDVLFNYPTIGQLLKHLRQGPLAALWADTDVQQSAAPAESHTEEDVLLNEMLARLMPR